MIRPVLLLGAEPRIAVTIARSLHRHGIPVDVGVLTEHEPVLASRAIRRFLRFPLSPSSPTAFIEKIQRQIQAASYDMLIPCSDSTLSACLSHYAGLSNLLHVACPPPQVTERVLNKVSTLEIADRCGIKIPRTYNIATLADLEASRDLLLFPIIAKPKGKLRASAFKTRRFDSFNALLHAFQENPGFGEQNLMQEYCTGVGLGIEVLLHQGRPVATFQHRRLKELPATGGVSVLAVGEAVDPHLLDQSLTLLNALQWDGVAMVEFLFDPVTRVATLMEVNGRYWGSLPLPVHSSVDFPYWHWQLVHGQQPDVSRRYRPGLQVRWLCGDLQRLHGLFFPPPPAKPSPGRFKELTAFIADFRPSVREMFWSWSDPLPSIRELSRELRQLAVAHAKNVARGVIPSALHRVLSVPHNLAPAAASVYRRRRIARGLGLISRQQPLPDHVRVIVSVCHGNIIRSPMTAALLRKALGDAALFSVTSAGLFAKLGKPADPRARLAAPAFGVSLDAHGAQPLTGELVDQADLILVMDLENEAVLLSRFPQARPKLFFLGAFDSQRPIASPEIPDPYSGSLADVQQCFARVDHHVRQLVSLLTRKRAQ